MNEEIPPDIYDLNKIIDVEIWFKREDGWFTITKLSENATDQQKQLVRVGLIELLHKFNYLI